VFDCLDAFVGQNKVVWGVQAKPLAQALAAVVWLPFTANHSGNYSCYCAEQKDTDDSPNLSHCLTVAQPREA
jgi:hypothetical protein